MPITINTIAQTYAANRLNRSQDQLSSSMEKLSSAKRINRAADDAAGLAIAAQMATQLLGSQQAYRNINDAISYSQTADGALSEVKDIVQRVRELSIQATNGTLNDTDRASIQKEVSQLQEEASRILETSEFNGQSLFNGNNELSFQSGDDSGESVTLEEQNVNQAVIDTGFFNIDVSTSGGASAALDITDQVITEVISSSATFGAFTNRAESIGRSLLVESENLAASKSRIMDADYALEMANKTSAMIKQQAGMAALAQGNVTTSMATQLLG